MDKRKLSDEELREARDIGVATYLSAFTHLMLREMDVNDSDLQAANQMALRMLEPLGFATQAAWYALIEDVEQLDHNSKLFDEALYAIVNKNRN